MNQIILLNLLCLLLVFPMILGNCPETDTRGWTSVSDSYKDGTDSESIVGDTSDFEFYGISTHFDGTNLTFFLNSNLDLRGKNLHGPLDQNINWGDLFINFDTKADNLWNSDHNLVFGVRFVPSQLSGKSVTQNSGVGSPGVYVRARPKSSTPQNVGWSSIEQYVDNVQEYRTKTGERGDPGFGDMTSKYYKGRDDCLDPSRCWWNGCSNGQCGIITNIYWAEKRAGGVTLLNFGNGWDQSWRPNMPTREYDPEDGVLNEEWKGKYTISFTIDVPSMISYLPSSHTSLDYIASVQTECGNDLISIRGSLEQNCAVPPIGTPISTTTGEVEDTTTTTTGEVEDTTTTTTGEEEETTTTTTGEEETTTTTTEEEEETTTTTTGEEETSTTTTGEEEEEEKECSFLPQFAHCVCGRFIEGGPCTCKCPCCDN